MYQVPVQKPERIRTSRKRVKEILTDIGLDSCQALLKELEGFDAGQDCFDNTDWEDLADCDTSQRRKKWCYRSQSLSCPLCWFSTRSWFRFKSHVQRSHDEERDLASLSPCSLCPYISRPALLSTHVKLFHTLTKRGPNYNTQVSSSQSQVGVRVSVAKPGAAGDKYSCTRCGFHDSLLYVIRKHVLVSHCETVLQRYYGRRSTSPGFYCCACGMPAETSEHLLYHLLSSDKHRELDSHISPLLAVHVKNNAPTAQPSPRTLQQVLSLVAKGRGSRKPLPSKGAGPVPSKGAVLLARPAQNTALLCSATGGRQMLLANQNAAAVATQPIASPSPAAPISLLLPSGAQTKQLPLTVTVPGPGQPTTQQVLLPPGVTLNLAGKVGTMGGSAQPLFLTQGQGGVTLSSSQAVVMNQGLPLQSQSTVRLVPTGNKVNGVPTYTLATVQMAVPVQSNVAMNTMVAVPQQTRQTQQQKFASVPGKGDTKELVTKSQYLVRTASGAIHCSSCKVLLSDKGIVQHLLHGLQCLFCPLIFYSLKQLLAHNEAEHSLALASNRERAKRQHLLITEDGRIVVQPAFDMKTTVPRDLLGCKELRLAIVTGRGKKALYLHLREEPSKAPTPSIPSSGCPFCPERPINPVMYEQHLRQQHHILPTIHAILKSAAFKCVYCLGVYTGKSTARTISIHVQRCRCAPRSAKEAERLLNPDTHSLNGDAGGAREGAAVAVLGKGRSGTSPFALEPPAGLELRSSEQRKYFLGQYFNKKPYPSCKETQLLAGRLKLKRTEVSSLFELKQKRCLRDCETQRLQVLLGFDTSRLRSLKHNLDLPRWEEGQLNSEEATQTKPGSDHVYAGKTSTDGPPTRPEQEQPVRSVKRSSRESGQDLTGNLLKPSGAAEHLSPEETKA